MHHHATSYRAFAGTLFLVAVMVLVGAGDDPNSFGTIQDPPEIFVAVQNVTTPGTEGVVTFQVVAWNTAERRRAGGGSA